MSEHGYRAVTIQMIAAEAGVGRQTLYRRWPSKAELVLEAFLESAGTIDLEDEALPLRFALRAYLRRLFHNLAEDGPAIRSLIASAQEDEEFLVHFRDRFVLPRAEAVARIFRRAIERGEIPAETDIETLLKLFHGAFWYPMLLGESLDRRYAAKLVDLFMGFVPVADAR